MQTFYLVQRNIGWVAQTHPTMGTQIVEVKAHSLKEAEDLAERKNQQDAIRRPQTVPVVKMGRK